MYITALHLRSFAKFKFEDTAVPLAPLSTIVGTNRSGKTSALRSFALLSLLMENAPRDDAGHIAPGRGLGSNYVKSIADLVAGADSIYLLHKGRAADEPIHIGAEFSDGASISFKFVEPGLDKSYVVDCKPPAHKFPKFRCTFFPRDVSYGDQTAKLLAPLKSTNSGSSLADKLSQQLWDGSNLGKITSNIVYYLNKKHPETFKELERILQSMFAGIGDMQIQLQGKNVNFQFVRTETTTVSSWVREGSGVAYVVSVFAAILFDKVVRYASLEDLATGPADPEPLHLLALDEPSSPLHPHLVGKFLDELQGLGISQIVMATHSVDLLARCGDRDSLFISLDSKPPYAIPSLSEPLLAGLGVDFRNMIPHLSARPDDLMLLGARRCLLFVENEGDWTRLQRWMDRVDGRRSRAFAEQVVVEWLSGRKTVYQYCENIRLTANVLTDLEKKLGESTGKPLRVAVSVDGDYIPVPILLHEQKQFKILLKKLCGASVDSASALWLTWKKVEGENYLLDKELIIRLIESGEIRLKGGGASNTEEHWDAVLASELQAIETRFATESLAKVKCDDNIPEEEKFNPREQMPSVVEYLSARWKEGCSDPATIVDAKRTLLALGVSEKHYALLIRDMAVVPGDIANTVEALFTWAQV